MSNEVSNSELENHILQLVTQLTEASEIVFSGDDSEEGYYSSLDNASKIIKKFRKMKHKIILPAQKSKIVEAIKHFSNSIFKEEVGDYPANYIEGTDSDDMQLCVHALFDFNAYDEISSGFEASYFEGKFLFDIDAVLDKCTQDQAKHLINIVKPNVESYTIRGDRIGNTWYEPNQFAYRMECIQYLEKAYQKFPELEFMVRQILLDGINYDLSDIEYYSLTTDDGIVSDGYPTMLDNSLEMVRILEKMNDDNVKKALRELYDKVLQEISTSMRKSIPEDGKIILKRIEIAFSNSTLDQY